MLRNLAWALAGAVLLAGPVLARPYTVADLLHLESLGRAAVDPSGRWLVFDKRAPYDSAPRFDYDGRPEVILGRLMVVDLAHPGPARPLIQAEPETGYTAGPFSPTGRAILVYRHRGETWEAGVIDLMTGKARWLSLVGDISDFGRTAQWRSDTELVMTALPPGTLPYDVGEGRRAMTRLPVLWDRAVWNKGVTMIEEGAGRYRDANPAPPSKRLLDVNLATGAVAALAEGPFTDLELSQDGRYVAALTWAEPERAVTDAVVRMGDPDRRRDLVLIDLAAGAVRHPLPGRDVVWSLLSWSPTTNSLLVYSRALDTAWSNGSFARIDARDGAVQDLGDPHIRPAIDWTPMNNFTIVRGAWLGDAPAVLARSAAASPEAPADWYRFDAAGAVNLTRGEAEAEASTDNNGGLIMLHHVGVWRYDREGRRRRLDTGTAKSLGSNPVFGLGLRGTLNPPRPASRLWAIDDTEQGPCVDGLGRRVPRVCLDPSEPEDQVLALASAGVVRHTVDSQGVGTLRFIDGSEPQPLATVNGFLATVDVVQPVPIVQRDPDGQARKSWLYLPPAYRPGQKLGLIIVDYPGSVHERPPYGGRADAEDFSTQVQVLVGQGYAVLDPGLPRASGSRDPSEGFTERLLADVDRLAMLGYVDPKRVALWGHSFGGYAALVVASRTHRFAAIISANGLSDLVSARGVFAPNYRVNPEDGYSLRALSGWAESGQGDLASTPWRDPELYARNSPIFFADRIDTPVLLFASELDIVGVGQQEEMFSALWRENKDAELVTFCGEGHVLASPDNIRAMYAKAFAFLDPLIGPAAAQR
jgi:dipeptidyl aminopeptidase/acylaminoacyl peptidase